MSFMTDTNQHGATADLPSCRPGLPELPPGFGGESNSLSSGKECGKNRAAQVSRVFEISLENIEKEQESTESNPVRKPGRPGRPGSLEGQSRPLLRTSQTGNPCGSADCRVCVALGFLKSPAPAPAVRLPGKTHPLTTPRASARAQRVLEAFLAFQAEHSRPPRLREVFRACGFANYGLMSRYLQLLELQGRARRVPTGGRGRWRHRWEVVA